MMATSVIDDLCNADKMNWFKAVQVMEITNEAIIPFIETEITTFHYDIRTNFRHGSLCGRCSSTTASYCSSRICSDITSQIESVHRYSPPCYNNSDITQWLSDPWEIAKCYMSRSKNLEGKPGSDIDFPSVLNVVINNTRFQRRITAVDMTNNNNIFCKGRDARNDVMHSRSHQMTAHDLNHYCDIFIDIVNKIGTDKAECVGKIEKVRDTPLSITAEDIVQLKEQAARYQGFAEVEELKKKWKEEIKKVTGKSLIPSFIYGIKESLCRLTTEHIQRQKPARYRKDDWTVEEFLKRLELQAETKDLSERHREMLFPSSGSPLDIEQWEIYLYYFVLNIELHQPLHNMTLLFMKDAKTLRDKLLANPSGVEKSELSNLCAYLSNPLKDDMLRILEKESTVADMMHADIVLKSWGRDEHMDVEASYRRSDSEKYTEILQVVQSISGRVSQIEHDTASARKEPVEMSDDAATGEAIGGYVTEAELKPYNASQADIEEVQKMMTSPDQNNCVLNNGDADYFLNKTGCSIDEYVEGSIILKVLCPSMETLFGFWKGCTDGTVVEAMSKIRDAYREHLGCDTLEFDIVLKKKEVTRCTNIIIGDLNFRLERLEKQNTDVDDPISKQDDVKPKSGIGEEIYTEISVVNLYQEPNQITKSRQSVKMNEGDKGNMQTSVPQVLLDIIDSINRGDERISSVERCVFHVLDHLNSIDAKTVNLEEILRRTEAQLNALAGRPLVTEAGVEGMNERVVAEGASSGDVVSSYPQGRQDTDKRQRADGQPITDNRLNASTQQLLSSEQPNVDQFERDLRDDARRPGPDYSRQPSRVRFRMQQRPVYDWAEIKPGQFVYLRYCALWHAVLVTGCDLANSIVKGINYGFKCFLAKREVSEDNFRVKLHNGHVLEVLVPEGMRVPAEEAVAQGRGKVGEKQYNMFTRRSRHVVLECVLK